MKKRSRFAPCGLAFLTALGLAAGSFAAPATDPALPHLVRKDGRHALIVDGAPFLILGAHRVG